RVRKLRAMSSNVGLATRLNDSTASSKTNLRRPSPALFIRMVRIVLSVPTGGHIVYGFRPGALTHGSDHAASFPLSPRGRKRGPTALGNGCAHRLSARDRLLEDSETTVSHRGR